MTLGVWWTGLTTGVVAALLPLAGATQVAHDFAFGAAAGVEYDDNITVTQIDAETNRDDFAALLEADASWKMNFGKSDSLRLGYIFSHSEQFEVTDFDLQLHATSATYEHEFDAVSAGFTHQFFYTRLGGDDLLAMHRATPFVTAFPARWLFLRGAYTFKNKNLIDRVARDADTHMLEAMGLVFVNGTHTFLTLRYRFEDEDAKGPEFDFQANIFKAGIDTRLPFGGEKNRFEVDVEYETRDYDNVTPALGEVRDDDRFTLDVGWTVPFGKYFYGEAGYRYRDFSSNLPSSNFTENVAAITFGFQY